MPVNKNALLRYRTIDKCLRNNKRKWTLEDLIDACSDALYEYTGKDDIVSKRTIQLDIQKMRSSELGYEAPIEVYENKYYRYSDPEYSITNTPLSEQDMEELSNAVSILKQLSGFAAFSGMEDIVGRLEDHLNSARHLNRPIIWFEKNDSLTGLHWITPLYQAIADKTPITITYHSFNSKDDQKWIFSPYALKEFRNRWFVYGRREGADMLYNLALDRIRNIEPALGERFIEDHTFNPETYFDNIIGVTKNEGNQSETVQIWADAHNAPYIRTKPLHHSQTIVRTEEDGSTIFQIEVVINRELEKDLLAFADGIKVLSPESLRDNVENRLRKALERYQ